MTLIAVMFAWVPFCVADMATATTVWTGMLGLNGIALPLFWPYADQLAKLLPGYIEVRHVFSAYVAEGGRIQILMVPIGLLVAIFLPNAYQWLGRFQPALYYPAAESPPVRWWRWQPHFAVAGVLAGLVLAAMILAGTSESSYLYWQF